MNADNIRDALMLVQEVFPIEADKFKGKHALLLQEIEGRIHLAAVIWVEDEGEWFPRDVYFDDGEEITRELLTSIRDQIKENPSSIEMRAEVVEGPCPCDHGDI